MGLILFSMVPPAVFVVTVVARERRLQSRSADSQASLVRFVGDFDPALVDDVIFRCVSQVGAQSCNIGRNVVLSSDLPPTVPVGPATGLLSDRHLEVSVRAIGIRLGT